ncbi:hypothetical protein HDU76_008030 [Blyttiomyces sp. JEL0837]|nr:hypothetical protein HDU76_008030 [Blyttiomyces sp. JEL0837]
MKFIVSIAAIIAAASYASATPVGRRTTSPLRVELESGAFTGKFITPFNDGVQIRAHLGIPFAQPPVGNLRFKQPQPITTNLGEVDATDFGPACHQFADPKSNLTMSEDCLQLNVWTPSDAQEGDRLPVLVWIYGGSFTSGYTGYSIYNGANIVYESLVKDKAIVVSVNYRLGPLGFLASKEIQAEGGLNAGLLDQRLGFEWVKKNIKKFGGDPNRITAFGESAGAISIGAHLTAVQPSSNPAPFTSAILESGAGSSGPRSSIAAIEKTLYSITANVTGCAAAPSILSCLRQIPAQSLTLAGLSALQKTSLTYGPIVDGTYIVENTSDSLKAGRLLQIPLLLGTNTDEGTLFTTAINSVQAYQFYLYGALPYASPAQIADLYTKYPLSAYNNTPTQAAAAVFGDFIFQCPVRQLADAYSSQNLPVYKYHFNHIPTRDRHPSLGVSHGSELIYVFNDMYVFGTDEEKELARNVVGYWTHFARRGAPNFGTSLKHWSKYERDVNLKNGGGRRLRMDLAVKGGFYMEVDDKDVDKCDVWMQIQELGSKYLS